MMLESREESLRWGDKYDPVLELGRGGMAIAYLTVVRGPAGFNKFQVIKELLADLAEEAEFVDMFLQEARLSARLSHPNVVQTNEVGYAGGKYFIAMEYVEGASLDQIIRRARHRGGVPVPIFLRIVSELLKGLHYAHELCDIDGTPLNVVHRDVSPHNAIISYDGHVKLADFGIAKIANAKQKTATGVLKGKYPYMAPEQLMGEDVDRRVDVFAAGSMLVHAVTGEPLWGRNRSDMEILQAIAELRIPTPRERKPDLSDELDAICRRALAPEREDRYATALECQLAIEAYLATLPEPITNREIGHFVSALFAERRATMKQAIEQQLALAGGISERRILQAASIMPEATPSKQRSQSGAVSAVADADPRTTGVSQVAGASRVRPFTIALAFCTMTGGGYYLRQATSAERSNAGAPNAARSAPAPAVIAAAPAPSYTLLHVEATPASARLYVDGAAVGGNPGLVKLVRDQEPHHVRAEAPGHVTKTEAVRLRDDALNLKLALVPAAAPAPAPAPRPFRRGGASTPANPPAAAPPAATPASAPPAAPPAREKDPLDQSDPWKK
ncbi:MAG: serine/threonine protein kinase [Polyangiaceae bacterium]|jgi:serine/threonine-protein kinase|nr:serine/threonine protein kinase [Polyangiaceae bacterium]